MTNLNEEDNNNDDASIEGHVNRMLFHDNDDDDDDDSLSSFCIESHHITYRNDTLDDHKSQSIENKNPTNIIASCFMDKIYYQHK